MSWFRSLIQWLGLKIRRTNSRGNQVPCLLEDVFATIKSVPSIRVLEDLVYIGQEIDALEGGYDFAESGYDFGLPCSRTLDLDVARLQVRNIILDTPTGLILTERGTSLVSRLADQNQKLLLHLASLPAADLNSLTAVLWARRLFADCQSESLLCDRIADYLLMKPEKVRSALTVLDNLKALASSRVAEAKA